MGVRWCVRWLASVIRLSNVSSVAHKSERARANPGRFPGAHTENMRVCDRNESANLKTKAKQTITIAPGWSVGTLVRWCKNRDMLANVVRRWGIVADVRHCSTARTFGARARATQSPPPHYCRQPPVLGKAPQ